MAKGEQEFNLEMLKTDPNMWKRLAMTSKNGDSLESVFKDKENPFEKNNQAAVETLQKLAAEGKLYLRDIGRSRHFQKVEKEADKLKLGDRHEMKLSNNAAGFGLSVLMRLSRAYFNWIGLERISNWFNKRLERRSELLELEGRYKEEYKSLTGEEKKELKALRKHEKNLKKLEKAQKEAEKTQQELDKVRGVDTSKTKGEMDAPLSQPPTVEQKENTMQPTLLGDQPVQENKPLQQTQENNPVQQTEQQEVTGDKKEEQKEKKSQLFIEGVELTEETAKQFPPHIVEAFKTIQQLIIEAEANENVKQQSIPVPPPLETRPTVNEIKQENPAVTEQTQVVEAPQVTEQTQVVEAPQVTEQTQVVEAPQVTEQTQVVEEPQVTEQVPQPQLTETEQREGVLIDLEDFQQNTVDNTAVVQTVDIAGLEQVFSNNPTPPTVDKNVPEQEMNAPLKNGADLETGQVNIQQRPKDQAQKDLQERLAAEKEAMVAVQNWKDFVANSLFSHEEGHGAKEFYQNVNKNNEAAGAEYLTGAVFGILSNKSANPEQKQQVMDALLSGKPLGSENAKLVDDGITAYNDAISRKTSGSSERLANMLAVSMRELGHQASRETTLSPRLVMIGRLLSNAAQMTKDYNLELPINEDEFAIIKGAGTLADVAQKYHEARQRLGNDFENISSKENRGTVRDLLMGNAVEKMIQQDKRLGQTISNAQMIMGKGLWEVKKLQTYISGTATRKGIQPEDVQAILKKPNSTKALGIGTKIAQEAAQASMEDYEAAEKAMQKHMELGDQEKQPEINPLGVAN